MQARLLEFNTTSATSRRSLPFALALGVVLLQMPTASGLASVTFEPSNSLDRTDESVFEYPFATSADMDAVHRKTRLMLDNSGYFPAIFASRHQELLKKIVVFTSTQTVRGESLSIIDFGTSDNLALRRLREEIGLKSPRGGAIVRRYAGNMPEPIAALFKTNTQGITMGGRYIAVRLDGMSQEEADGVVAHELVHAYINARTGSDRSKLPAWFHEGAAMYLSGEKSVYRSATGLHMAPDDYRAYRAMFRYLESEKGHQGVARFIRQAVEESVDVALLAAIGTTSYEELHHRAIGVRFPKVPKISPQVEWLQWLVCLIVLTVVTAFLVNCMTGSTRAHATFYVHRQTTVPSAPDNPFDLGVMQYRDSNHDAALDLFSAAIALNPQNAGAYVNRGNCYFAKNRFDEAIADYDEAIRLDQQLGAAFTNRGNVWLELRCFERAIEDYFEALRINPEDAEAKACLEAVLGKE